MKKGVIILGKGSATALAVHRSLQNVKIPTYIISSDPNGCSLYTKETPHQIFPDPVSHQDEYIKKLVSLSKNLEGYILMPTEDAAVETISRNRELLTEYYRVPVPGWDIIKKCIQKEITYEIAEKLNVPYPITIHIQNPEQIKNIFKTIRLPCIIKGSTQRERKIIRKKVAEFNDKKSLIKFSKYLLKNKVHPLIQEKIPGKPTQLYSLCSALNYDSEPIGIFCGRKIRQNPYDFGVGTLTESIKNEKVVNLGLKLLQEIKYYGISMVEFKYDIRDDQYKLIEINARPWLWTSLATHCGVNLPYIIYKMVNNETVSIQQYKEHQTWHYLTLDAILLMNQLYKKHPIFSFKEYIKSYNRNRTFAVLSPKDPKPFIIDTVNHLKQANKKTLDLARARSKSKIS